MTLELIIKSDIANVKEKRIKNCQINYNFIQFFSL